MSYGFFFIAVFIVAIGTLIFLFRSIVREDAIDHEKLNPKRSTAEKGKSTRLHQKKQGNWLTFRGVQISLGILWLLDGLLQLQHQMFTKAFITQVIGPAAQGQPHFVSGAMNFGIHLFLLHPAIFNSLAAITQIGLGVLILNRRTMKLGLLLSIPWGAVVWVFGEGFGGIFSGHTLLLMGAPGAVLLYMLLALSVLPRDNKANTKPTKPHVAYWLAFVWLIIWVGGGVYQLLPGQNSTADVGSMIATNASSTPSWLSSIDTSVAHFVQSFGEIYGKPQIQSSGNMTGMQMSSTAAKNTPSHPGFQFILLIAILQFCIGIGVLVKGLTRKTAIWIGISFAMVFWVVGENLGTYYSGTATDPNSGPLLVLLGLAILGCHTLDPQLVKIRTRFYKVVSSRTNARMETEFDN